MRRNIKRRRLVFSEIDISLLLYEISERSLFSILMPYARRILRHKNFSMNAKIAALDFVERVWRTGMEYDFCDLKNDLCKIIRNDNYLVASIALETFFSIYDDMEFASINLSRSRNQKLLVGELACYKFIKGNIQKEKFLQTLSNISHQVLARSCWRIVCVLHHHCKGRKILRGELFFNNESWHKLMLKHGKRGVFSDYTP